MKQNIPLKPTALINIKKIDDNVGEIAGRFWKNIWNKDNPAVDLKTKLLLSMSNAVGSGRFRQASRELIKAYSLGVTIDVLDELFALFIWNQGIGHFASEIGPSQFFKIYKTIKELENKKIERKEIVESIMESFGENNPQVGTNYKS